MLNAQNNRLDYGELLQPPSGYELDSAVATTYSLDLEALLAIPIALCFHNTLEGDLRGEKLALLESIGQLKGRIKVFYQAGKIKLPSSYNRLFALLEPYLQPMLPSGGVYSSFHPKLWLLRYVAQGEAVKYRLIVLSRNLTLDRSWDLAVSLDGQLEDENQERTDAWVGFVNQLLEQSPEFVPGTQLKNEIGRIKWQSPTDFWDPRLLPGGPELGAPIDLLSPSDQLLVVSPFIKDSAGYVEALDQLAKNSPDGNRWLFSRAEELNSIGEEKLVGWDCFSINEDVVDGEERLQLSEQRQNLHAKLIVNKRGQTTHWHVGSANATSAALGGTAASNPRNTEFMIRLTGRTQIIGPEVLLNQWVGDNDQPGLFVPHKFILLDQDDGVDLRNSIRKAIYMLTQVAWMLTVTQDEQGSYHLKLDRDGTLEIDSKLRVEIGQLAIDNAYLEIESCLEWKSVNLSQISALIPIRIIANNEQMRNSLTKKILVQAELRLPEGINREQAILSEMVNSESKFLNYIRLLLQQQPDKNEWLGYDAEQGGNEGIHYLFDDSPLFEQLMDAAARNPESLERISQLLKRIQDTGVPIPKSFQRIWPHFENIVE